MSHFAVLVAGENPEFELAPFHEFECTGDDNEFVQELDRTEEFRIEYEHATTTRYKAPDGTMHRQVPVKSVQSFAEWVQDYHGQKITTAPIIETEHKYGFTLVNSENEVLRVVDRTNPNYKWDWWTVGGRYTGLLLLKDGRRVDTARKSEIDCNDETFSVFAFVYNREWHERGKMGWFASVSDEKDSTEWNQIVRGFIKSLPDNELLTVVDCHI